MPKVKHHHCKTDISSGITSVSLTSKAAVKLMKHLSLLKILILIPQIQAELNYVLKDHVWLKLFLGSEICAEGVC